MLKAYADVGRKFADDTQLRRSELATTSMDDPKQLTSVKLTTTQPPAAAVLPKWSFETQAKGAKKPKADQTQGAGATTKARITEHESEECVVTLTFGPAEFDELLERYGVTCEEELATEIRECLMSGVAFILSLRI